MNRTDLIDQVQHLNATKRAKKNNSGGLIRLNKKLDYSITYAKGPLADQINQILHEAGMNYKIDPQTAEVKKLDHNTWWVEGQGMAVTIDQANSEIFRIIDVIDALKTDNKDLKAQNLKLEQKILKENEKVTVFEEKWERELAENTPLPPPHGEKKVRKRKVGNDLARKGGKRAKN